MGEAIDDTLACCRTVPVSLEPFEGEGRNSPTVVGGRSRVPGVAEPTFRAEPAKAHSDADWLRRVAKRSMLSVIGTRIRLSRSDIARLGFSVYPRG